MRQLKAFEAIAKNTSYTRAAKELHLNQPAVSMQVRQLGQVMGVALFQQAGRQISLPDRPSLVGSCAGVSGLRADRISTPGTPPDLS